MSAPVTSKGSAGNLLASSTNLGAGASTTFDFDITGAWKETIQIGNTGGSSVAGVNGVQVDVYRRVGSTPVNDAISVYSFIIPTIASTANPGSFVVGDGQWHVKLTNLDASNATTVSATGDQVTGIQ